MPKRVLITVAEVSGDKHAAGMVRALKQLDPSIQVDALGGPALASAGATVRHETVTGAAMTLHGAKRIFEMMRLLKWVKRFYRDPATRPDLQVCVDSSAINLHFARAAKEAGIPVLYYVAPQLWASREGRMKKVRKYVARLACIFPFEEMYFRSHGVEATFVGHPLFDELPRERPRNNGPSFPDAPPVIGIVAGSRKSEVVANLPGLVQVANAIRVRFPDARFLIPTTSAGHATVKELLRVTGFQPVP